MQASRGERIFSHHTHAHAHAHAHARTQTVAASVHMLDGFASLAAPFTRLVFIACLFGVVLTGVLIPNLLILL